VLVRERHGVGIAAECKADQVVQYAGKQVAVTL